jgi:hypothetical protein
MESPVFSKFWSTDLTRECLLSFVPQDDLKQLRLVCRSFANNVASELFRDLVVHFGTNTFSRRARLTALESIGHHVRTMTFDMPHTPSTFLPPLIAPDTLEELTFIYEPHTKVSRPSSAASASSASSSKYGSWDIDDLLIKHYPPIFHAATNIQAFARAVRALPYIRQLNISCPGQEPGQRYRRDAVDYALVSLRVAIEQVNPSRLERLALNPIHPGAIFSLRPQASYGSSPASTRIWKRIKCLEISMASFSFGRDSPADHLKALHTYLQSFNSLEHFAFTWIGDRGPCPLSLDAEPCTSRPSSLDVANACPKSCILPSCKPIRFRRLKTMRLRNAIFDASQAETFVVLHRKILHEFSFDECSLRSGTWEEVLSPLSHVHGRYKERPRVQEEVMDVPLLLSPVDTNVEAECVQSKLWEDISVQNTGMQTLRSIGSRTKALVPGHVKRLLRAARLAWRV